MISRRYFNNSNGDNDDVETLEQYLERVESGDTLRFYEFEDVLAAGPSDPSLAYEVMHKHTQNVDDLNGIEVVKLLASRAFKREYDIKTDHRLIEDEIDAYFRNMEPSEAELEILRTGMPERMSVDDVLNGLDKIRDSYAEDIYENMDDLRQRRIDDEERNYLLAVKDLVNWLDL